MAFYETPYPVQRRRKRIYGALLGFLGVALPVGTIYLYGFPTHIGLWVVFAFTFFVLDFYAVEINDRMMTSSSAAVLVAAGIALGPAKAIGGLLAMAVVGFAQPRDFAQRRVFEPIANLGIGTINAAVAALALAFMLPGDLTALPMWRFVAAGALAAGLADFASVVITRTAIRQVYGSKLAGPWSNLAQIILSFVGLGIVGGLLGYAYVAYAADHGTYNAMLILVIGMLLMSRLFYASLAKLRAAREGMLATLVKTLEAKDLYTRGHTERVARFAVQLAQELGLGGDMQERIRHSALIHDLGKLAVPRELLKKRGRLTSDETTAMRDHVHHIDALLNDVQWLHPLVRIASDHHAHFDGGGYHGSHTRTGDTPTQESRVLAIADAFDAMTSNRPYRMALTQEEAFNELREGAGSQFDPDMVEAFVRMIERGSLRYGAIVRMTDEEARELAEQRGWLYRD